MKIYKLAFLWYIPIISGLLFPFLSACDHALEFPQSSLLPDSQQKQKIDRAGDANIVYKSTDGGQTWQDISKGLPENLQKDSIRGNSFFVNDKGLFLRVGNGLYHSTASATSPFWTKEIVRNGGVQLLDCKCKKNKRNKCMVAGIRHFSDASSTQRF